MYVKNESVAMLPGERTAESWHDLLRRMSRRWRPGFGRPAAIRMPDVVGRLRCRCWPGSTATVPRAGRGADDGNSVATPFLFSQAWARPSATSFYAISPIRTCVGRPLRRAPLSASHFRCGVCPLSRFVRHHPPAALGPRRGSFSSSRQAPVLRCLPRGRASTLEP